MVQSPFHQPAAYPAGFLLLVEKGDPIHTALTGNCYAPAMADGRSQFSGLNAHENNRIENI